MNIFPSLEDLIDEHSESMGVGEGVCKQGGGESRAASTLDLISRNNGTCCGELSCHYLGVFASLELHFVSSFLRSVSGKHEEAERGE